MPLVVEKPAILVLSVVEVAGLNTMDQFIAVPRHPFRKQDCKFSIHSFLTPFGLSLMWADIIIR